MADNSRAFRNLSRVCGLLGLLATASCATTDSRPTPWASSVAGPITPRASGTVGASAIEERSYRDAYTLYTKGAYEAALQKLQRFEVTYPRSPLTSQTQNLQGLCYLLTRRPFLAVPRFQRALDVTSTSSPLRPYLLYNLGDAQFESGQIEEAQRTCNELRPELMDKDNRIKAHYLKARVASKRGQAVEASRESLAAGRLLQPTTSKDTRNAVATLLDQSLKDVPDPGGLEELSRAYEDSVFADLVLYHIGSKQLAAGNREKGEANLKLLLSRYPDSAYYAQATDLIRASEAGSLLAPAPSGSTAPSAGATVSRDTGPVRSMHVGLLLPMKGKFAKFGARSLQGIELAFRVFNHNEPDSKVTLVVEDSGDDAESAVRALDRLVTKHHVVGVIGPLLSKGIDQVTQRAQDLGVPLISLSRHLGIQNDYVFQAGLTMRLQTREIARYAIESLGLKRFAIVYPRDKVGEDAMQKFWDAVESLGGTITGVESYNAGETDFRHPVDRLSGLHYSEARSRELDELAKLREANKIKRRTRKTEQYFALKPIIDYDAVFIPEEPKVTGQILPTFAYRDVDGVKFLGTSAWNSPELATRAQPSAENAFFLDAFLPESESPAVRKYAERYKATFNQEPTAMDALAYDAARILESILARHNDLTRIELKEKLQDIKNFPGVTGKISFQDGQFSRDLKILSTRAGRVIEVTR